MSISLQEFKILINSKDSKDQYDAVSIIYEILQKNFNQDITIDGVSISLKDTQENLEDAYGKIYLLLDKLRNESYFYNLPGRI